MKLVSLFELQHLSWVSETAVLESCFYWPLNCMWWGRGNQLWGILIKEIAVLIPPERKMSEKALVFAYICHLKKDWFRNRNPTCFHHPSHRTGLRFLSSPAEHTLSPAVATCWGSEEKYHLMEWVTTMCQGHMSREMVHRDSRVEIAWFTENRLFFYLASKHIYHKLYVAIFFCIF